MDLSKILSVANGGEMAVDSLEQQKMAAGESGVILYSKNGSVVLSSATISGVAMTNNYNVMMVYSGGVAEEITQSGSKTRITVFPGGVLSGGYMMSGNSVIISGGEVRDAILEGNVSILSGGVVNGGAAGSAADDGLFLDVSSGGLISGFDGGIRTTVRSGGVISAGTFGYELIVEAGGIASSIVCVGKTTISAGANARKITLKDQGSIMVNACVVSGMYLEEGGGVTSAVKQGVGSRGYIGELVISAPNPVKPTILSAYINGFARDLHMAGSGTKIRVASGAIIYDSIIDGSSVILYVEDGATVESCTADGGGTINVSSGAVAINTKVVNAGTLKLGSGAIVKGLITSGANANVDIVSGAGKPYIFDFDLNYYNGGVMINDMSQLGKVKGASKYNYKTANITYQITMAEATAGKTYELAGGLSTTYGLLDDKVFTVYSDKGVSLGTVQVGTDLDLADGTKLSLTTSKAEGLKLTVSGVETPSLTISTGDDIVNAHDGLISLREALAYAKQGIKSDVAGHVGEKYIDAVPGVTTIDINSLAIGDDIVLDLGGATLNITQDSKISNKLSISNSNITRAFSFGAETVSDKSLTNGINPANVVTVDGDTTLTIVGTASTIVNSVIVGGGLVSAHGDYTVTGTAYTVIKGGQYNKNIFGGAAGVIARYGNTSKVGGTSISIDASTAATTINGDIYAGGFGTSRVAGDALVNFTGSGANLTVNGLVIGDSSFATVNGTYSPTEKNGRYVQGARMVAFNSFTGDFAGKIIGGSFDEILIGAGTDVNFTNTSVDFAAIDDWSFTGGVASFADGINNDFTDGSFAVDGTYGAHTVLMDGSASSGSIIEGFDALAAVYLFGEKATWDSGSSSWKTATYALSADDMHNDIVLNQLA